MKLAKFAAALLIGILLAGSDQIVPGADPGERPAAYVAEEPAANGNGEEEEKDETPKQWKLFHGPRLEKHNIDIRGWIDQGFTWNPGAPAHGPFQDFTERHQFLWGTDLIVRY